MKSKENLIKDLRKIIESSRNTIYRQVNTELLKMYLCIGEKISESLNNKTRNAEKRMTITSISKDLSKEYGKGYSRRNLSLMLIFYTKYKKWEAVPPTLNWSHFIELLSIKNGNELNFYQELCCQNHWSQRELRRQIKSGLYQRTLLANPNDIQTLKNQTISKDGFYSTPKNILKEPFVLEFFKHREKFLEKDLEESILSHMKEFMLELGQGFLFMGNQYHLNIENKHYYVDLVFYNKILNSYVLIELKAKPVDHNAIGQINMYLNYFKEHINQKDDNDPIGIIMCTDKNNIEVEYALGGMSNQIFVSKYITHLPKKEDLEKELSKLIK